MNKIIRATGILILVVSIVVPIELWTESISYALLASCIGIVGVVIGLHLIELSCTKL